jgi:hypothetical protein
VVHSSNVDPRAFGDKVCVESGDALFNNDFFRNAKDSVERDARPCL